MPEPLPAADRGRDDQPPRGPPRPLSRSPTESRTLEIDGESWTARVAGSSVAGTGSYNLALVEAVHFAPAKRDAAPRREALLPHGVFAHLADAELVTAFRRARPLSDTAGA